MSIKTDLASNILSIRTTHFSVQESSTGLVDEVDVLAAVVEGHFRRYFSVKKVGGKERGKRRGEESREVK